MEQRGAHTQTSAAVEELEVSPSRNGFTITIEDKPASAAPRAWTAAPRLRPSRSALVARAPPRKVGTLEAHIMSAPGRTHAR